MPDESEEAPEAKVQCPGCKKMRPLADVQGVVIEYDPESSLLMLCKLCRDGKSTPKKYDPRDHLNLAERCLLRALMKGAPSIAAAAREAGIPEKRALRLISGEARPVVRKAYQLCLTEQGLTLAHVSQRIFEATNAEKAMWNPEKKVFDSFVDHNVRLKASSTAAKHLQIEEPEKMAGAGGGPTIVVQVFTNLDDPNAKTRSRETFVAESAIDVTPDVSP